MSILIKNCLILPMDRSEDSTLYFRGSVGVHAERIVMVCAQTDADYQSRIDNFIAKCAADQEFRIIDGTNFLAMPGLINIHNHASMSLMRSYADDLPLMAWINEKIWPFEAKMTPDDVYLGAELGVIEMLLGGTTTFVDMYWWQQQVAEVVDRSGIRAVLSPTFTSKKFEEFESDLKEVVERYVETPHKRIGVMIAPHAPYSCSTEHLVKARELAKKYGVGINIHVAETQDEAVIIEERFGKTPVEYLNDLGLFTDRSIAVHCVHLSDSDIAILKSSGTSVAHNPQSNMKLSSGTSPVAKMLAAGINVGVGTDGPCSNNDLDMWDELRSASFLHKLATNDPCVLPAYQVLRMGTVNGARAIGRENDLGTITEGKLADIVLVDIEKPHMYPRYDMVANLVYCAKSSDVDTVIVNGEIVVKSRRVLKLDVERVCNAVQKRAEELADSL